MPLPLMRTPVEITVAARPLTYRAPCVLMGSCFTGHMGGRLERLAFPCHVNPFGVLYNPASIANSVDRLVSALPFSADELEHDGHRWFSFSHHGQFSGADLDSCLELMNQRLASVADALRHASHLFLTFGTAWIFELRDSGRVVANCHRQPGQRFARRLLSVEEIVARYVGLIESLRQVAPQALPVFSISPVRHWKDTAPGNQRSKATLVLAIHELTEQTGAAYFPAYEIVMDELRDYRYYAEDMLHIGPAGQEYVWGRFADAWIDASERPIMQAIGRIRSALEHRPHDPQSAAHAELLRQTHEEAAALQRQHPLLELGSLLAGLEEELER
jgi:hypothetical protein